VRGAAGPPGPMVSAAWSYVKCFLSYCLSINSRCNTAQSRPCFFFTYGTTFY